ncbi:alpha/beta hydrolase [Jannaschia sp. CCS1]|uniref:alpha/beta hydrolase n=1 Tax=Jannaschia sp. (strain CCS1) TaxID=290400 RepID=UPI000053B3EB|nr:alpha/beta hydrolase [Jannaschia sp. CCS1]ABD53304.1 Alpha/beta hydrolase fold-3 [Jannaschia sp. CCS1]
MGDTAPYPGLAPDLWDLAREMAADPDPVPEHLRPISQLRAAVARMEAALPPVPDDIQTRDWTMDVAGRAVPLRSYQTADARAAAMLYIHGGGWSLGSIRGHDLICADIARDTGLRVVSIDYALAPEHPYPAALTECVAVFQHLRTGASPLETVPGLWLGGDSAGGNLALGAALKTKGAAGLFLIYPATDPTCGADSYTTHANAPYLSRDMMHRCWRDYLGGQSPDIYTSPNTADLRSLPQAVILTATLDPLLGDGEELAATFLAAGTPVWYETASGLIHGFLRFRAISPASDAAFRRATAALAVRL